MQYKPEFESSAAKFYNIQSIFVKKNKINVKSKIRRTFESYLQIKTPYKYKEATSNKSIISKQEKGHELVILNHRNNVKKCLKMLVND